MASCAVCGAPPLARSCVFCHTPSRAYSSPTVVGLLDYLAQHLPHARVQRAGLLRRGPVRRFQVHAGGGDFAAGFRKGELALQPPGTPAEWANRLLAALSRDAAADPEVRQAVSRSGWALR
ncbi:MAG: hypothetical protein ABI838_01445 [Chloroflexota bacterium]